LQVIPGDYNGDRIVDAADYAAWRGAFGATGNNPADGNQDGVVDGADYLIWRRAVDAPDFGSGSGQQLPQSSFETSTVPEPTSVMLVGLAMVCAAGVIRKR
jgi:hypothetical protein